jgi:hypothetical protein
VDFIAAKLGRPHQMRFGAYSLYAGKKPEGQMPLHRVAGYADGRMIAR